jgi:hypothetical protein
VAFWLDEDTAGAWYTAEGSESANKAKLLAARAGSTNENAFISIFRGRKLE